MQAGSPKHSRSALHLKSHCLLQADIYSLGVLLWELVTADVPQRGRMRPVKVSAVIVQLMANPCKQVCLSLQDGLKRNLAFHLKQNWFMKKSW